MLKIKQFIAFVDKKIDIKKFIKFVITGLINTAIDFGVYSICLELLNFDVKVAQPIGQTFAIINSYFMNKNWTFEKRSNYNLSEILKFLLVNGASIGINIFGVYLFHDVFGFNEYLCKIPIMFITIIINYFGNRLFVFK